MKSSLIKEPRKSRDHNYCIQPIRPLKNCQNISPRRVTFEYTPQISVNISSDKPPSDKQFTNQKIISQKTSRESQKLIDQISQLKESLKSQRNQRKNLLYEIQTFFQKENFNIYNSSFTEAGSYSQQRDEFTDFSSQSEFVNKRVIADSFLDSFRAVFTFYVDLYFQKLTLALQLKKKYFNAFLHLLKYIDFILQDSQNQVEVDQICMAIYRMIKNQNGEYKIFDIKYGLQNIFHGKFLLKASDFAHIFQTIEKHSYLSNPSNFFINMSFEEILRDFFEVFAQFYDTQIKFKKICKANEKKLTSLLVELSVSYELNVKFLAEFLYFDVKKSKNWLVMRFEEFFQDHFGTKDKAINLLKWLKQQR